MTFCIAINPLVKEHNKLFYSVKCDIITAKITAWFIMLCITKETQ